MMIEFAIAMCAFCISTIALAYNIYELGHIRSDIQKGNEHLAKLVADGHERIARILERVEKRLE